MNSSVSYEFLYLMRLVGASALGQRLEATLPVPNYGKLMALAKNQGVAVLAADALRNFSGLDLPPAVSDYTEALFFRLSADELVRRKELAKLIGRFEESGIRCLILKGQTAAERYHNPISRISGDVDLLIYPKDERKALLLLEKEGCQITRRNPGSHHSEVLHPMIGELELHIALYEDSTEKLWFRGLGADGDPLARRVRRECKDGEYCALALPDELNFLSLHLIKHLLSGGVGLKSISDLALCYRSVPEALRSSYWARMDKLGFTLALESLLALAELRMGIACGFGSASEETLDALCFDIESGGAFGRNAIHSRVAASAAASSARGEGGQRGSRLLRRLQYRLKSIFPSPLTLRGEYPILREKPLLAPALWLCYLARHSYDYVLRRRNKTAPRTDDAVAAERRSLFEKLGLL